MKTLLNLSGGIDSTYVAYKWLKEHPKEKLLIHHCSLRTREERWKKEDEAASNIIQWLKENGLDNFEYIESVMDNRQIKPSMWDSSIMAVFTAMIVNSYGVTQVLNNTPKDEYTRLGQGILQMLSRARQIRQAITSKPLDTVFMLKDMSKRQIIESMPKELFELCWYCRIPQGDETCGQCHTCKQVKESGYETKKRTSTQSRSRKRKQTES